MQTHTTGMIARRFVAGLLALALALTALTTLAPTANAIGGRTPRTPIFDRPITEPTDTPTPEPAPACEPGPAHRYRVTINGFKADVETWDHAFEVDGKGDEVYFDVQTTLTTRDGMTHYDARNTSRVMGDTEGFSYRVEAGSRSTNGGIKSGDRFPSSTPWTQLTAPTTSRDYPPYEVWEGDLRANCDAITISPSLWEWDGGGDAYNDWISWANNLSSNLSKRSDKLFGNGAQVWFDLVDMGLSSAAALPIGSAGDKPIGTKEANGVTSFQPQLLVLDQQAAEILLASEPIGLGKGVTSLTYAGDSGHGKYTMYLQVERVS